VYVTDYRHYVPRLLSKYYDVFEHMLAMIVSDLVS